MPYQYLPLFIILGATLLRFRVLSQHSIAFDEGFSLAVSSGEWPLLFKAILSDGVHPPFFYVLFKFALVLFGSTEFGARFFTAALSIAGIPMIYALGKTMFSRRAGSIAALLLAVSPLHIWLAQEARMYSLLSFLMTLNFWYFWQITKSPRRLYWIGLSVTSALMYIIHYFALLAPIIQFAYILLTFRRRHKLLRPWMLSQIVAGLALLPWLILTAHREVKSFGIAFLVKPHLQDIAQTLWNMTLGFAPNLWLIAVPGLLIVGLSLLLALKRIKKHSAVLLLLLWGFIPPALVWIISQQRSFYADRYLSFTIPALLLLIAFGLTQIKQPQAANGLAALLAILALSSHLLSFNTPPFTKDKWRDVSQYIEANNQAGDIILLRSPHIQLPFKYYYGGPAEQKLASFNQESYNIDALVDPTRRVWVVVPYTRRPTHYPMQPDTDASVWELDPDAQNIQEYVESNQDRIVESKRFLGVQIWLIDKTDE